jgi:tetratricopeptide (TPR) repeat protein
MIRHPARVICTLTLLVTLCGLVVIAGSAARGASAQSADPFLECAILRGQPAVDACDEVMRSRLAVELRAEAAYKKGVELAELTRDGDSVKAYRAAIRLKRDYAAAYADLGVSLSRLERWQEASSAYENAIRLAPADVDTHYNLGVALVMLGRPDAGDRPAHPGGRRCALQHGTRPEQSRAPRGSGAGVPRSGPRAARLRGRVGESRSHRELDRAIR